MRTIRFKEGEESRELIFYDCVYCGDGNVIVERKVIHNTGYGSHTDYKHIAYLSGRRKSKMMLCDSCRNFDKRISDLKELERKIKRAKSRIEDFGKLMDEFRSSAPSTKVET